MAINMQGTWCISLKTKNTNQLQKIEISGASSGNGTYDLCQIDSPVLVNGEHWTLRILQKVGKNYMTCRDQIRFPYKSEGKYIFNIETNETDSVENRGNTVLSCCTPQTTSDFLIYGNVSIYDDPCFFNPFYHFWIVLETRDAFYEALKYDVLRSAIKKLYLDRLAREILMPFSERTSEDFVPLIIPIHDETIIPPSLGQVLKINRKSETLTKQIENYSITPVEIVTLSQPQKLEVELNRTALSNLFDQVLPRCLAEPLGDVELHFYEYIRTNNEFCGGLYSGEGKRKKLGSCIGDQSGNYIFHFCKSKNTYLNKSVFNQKLDKDSAFQFMPDVLIQLRDKKNNQIIHETIPYWNLPLFKRINICFPKKKIIGFNDFWFTKSKLELSDNEGELFVV